MTFDNSKTIISLRITLFVITVVLLGWLALAYAGRVISFPLFGQSDLFWTLMLVSIWLFTALFPLVLNYQYIKYNDEGDKIIIRYFTAGIIGGRKNSLEIPKPMFSGYDLIKKRGGLSESIVLYRKMKDGIAKYPPVHISALSRKDREMLLRSLNSMLPKA